MNSIVYQFQPPNQPWFDCDEAVYLTLQDNPKIKTRILYTSPLYASPNHPMKDSPAVPFPGNAELAAFLRKLEHRIMLTRDDKILLAHAADTVEATPSQEPGKCAQCKKPYRKGANTEGCPKCAPGVDVSESEFQKPISAPSQEPLTNFDAIPDEVIDSAQEKSGMYRVELMRAWDAIIAALREKQGGV